MLKINGDAEAAGAHGVHRRRVLQRADDIFAKDSNRGLAGQFGRVHSCGSVSDAGRHLAVLACRDKAGAAPGIVSEWIPGPGSHCGLSVFEPCSASWLGGVLLLALCMSLHGFVGQEVALLA